VSNYDRVSPLVTCRMHNTQQHNHVAENYSPTHGQLQQGTTY